MKKFSMILENSGALENISGFQASPGSAPRAAVWSGSTLFATPPASFGLITLW